MDIRRYGSLLKKNVAYMPGSRDRSGGPLLVVNPALISCGKKKSEKTSLSANGSSVTALSPTYEEIVSLIGYLAQIPDENSVQQGFTVLIDGRRASIKQIRNALRACQHALYRQIRVALIVQPDKFLDQQKLNFDLIREAYEFKTTLTSVHKLSRYIDVTQLPENLGGTFSYNPSNWINMREKFENFTKTASSWIESARRHDKLSFSDSDENSETRRRTVTSGELLKNGDELLDDLLPRAGSEPKSGNADWNAAMRKAENLMKQIKTIEEGSAAEAKRAQQRAQLNASFRLLEVHAQGVRSLIDWIAGAGENWLQTMHEIGESYDDAKQLLKDHTELEAKTKDVEQQSQDLCEMAHKLALEFPSHSMSLEQSAEKLQKVIQVFCSRVLRQTAAVQQSVNFHQMLNEFSHKTDLLLESLCTEAKAADIASVEKERDEMENKVDEMEKIYHEVVKTGVSFIDDLCIDESNASGRAVARDYSPGIVHIKERLDETRDRRRRCQSLADVRRLKVQQLLQLYTCEKDGQQAVLWIEELYETLMNNYEDIGCSADQVRALRGDRMKLEATARSTYEYGKQLCQVAMVLRRSLGMEVQPQLRLNQRLESVWGKLCRALSENEAKLNITDAFHSTVEKVNDRLDEMNSQLCEFRMLRHMKHKQPDLVPSHQSLSSARRGIANDIRELKHIADMLVDQIVNRTPKTSNGMHEQAERNRAIEEIQRKFAQLESKNQELEETWLNKVCAGSSDDNCASNSTAETGDPPKLTSSLTNGAIRKCPSNERLLNGSGSLTFKEPSSPCSGSRNF